MKFLFVLVTLFFTLGVQAEVESKTPEGKLICWDDKHPTNYIDGYRGELNKAKIDDYGRRSFIMDFNQPLEDWGYFHENELYQMYGWSYSECEDSNEFIFPKHDLDRVLSGKQKSLKVNYIADGPDDVNRVSLRCVKMTDKNPGRPVFKF